ncbi:MAG: hypothetical protein PHW32_02210 [Bacilli bacterium]|nr:hypothetical protein [Bacilli bacterium]MDD4282572.1 hypothetical protein [Bacilli bacterium]MDD4718793.1 hypothetical protein [Bacilli bacterium]
MKKKSLILSIISLGLVLISTGCGYISKGHALSCTHPTKGTYKIYEHAGLSKKEWTEVKEKYEAMGYTCR